MAHIDYFYTLLSPFTYMAGDRLEQIADRHGATIAYRPADFPAIFAETGGLPVPKRHPFRQSYRLQELKRLSAHAGVPLTLNPAFWPVDATQATLSVLAVDAAGGDTGALSRAYLRAVWAEDRDISNAETVATILRENGHDASAILEAAGGMADTYAANTKLALENEVFGAPFYVVGGERFWGHDRLDFLDRHLASIG